MLTLLVYLMLFLLPVQRVDLNLRFPIGGTRWSELIAVVSLMMVVAATSIRSKAIQPNHKVSVIHQLFVVFFIIIWTSSLMTFFIGDYTLEYVGVRSSARVQPWLASITALMTWTLGISAFYAVVAVVKKPWHLRQALKWWILGASFCSAAGIYGAFALRLNWPLADLFPMYPDPNQLGRIYGFVQEPRELAIFLSSVLPFLLLSTLQRKFVMTSLFQWLCLIMVSLAFLMTLSRSTLVLTMAIVFLFLAVSLMTRLRAFWSWRNFLSLLVTGIVVVLILQGALSVFRLPSLQQIITIQFQSLSGDTDNISNLMQRVSYEVAWKTFVDHPILGVGIGNFPFYIDRYMPPIPSGPQWEWLHNSGYYKIAGISNNIYLDFLAQTGILGTIAFVAIIAYLAFKGRRFLRFPKGDKTWVQGLLIGYLTLLASQIFSSTFSYAYVWALMGLLYVAIKMSWKTISITNQLEKGFDASRN